MITPDPGKGLRPPAVPNKPKAPEKPSAPRIPFHAPSRQADTTVASSIPDSSFTISYQLSPRSTLEHTFDSTAWIYPKDVNYAIQYRTEEVSGTGGVTAAASLLNHLADVTESVTSDGLYRYRFNPASDLDPLTWQNLLLSDLQQDSLNIRSALQATVQPLQGIPLLSSSNVTYRLGNRLYTLKYLPTSTTLAPIVTATGPSWDATNVTDNTLISTLALKTPDTADSLGLSLQMPPLIPTFGVTATGAVGIFSARFQGSLSQTAGVIQYQPLVTSATLQFAKSISASEEIQVDPNTSSLSRSTSSVQLGGLTTSLVAQQMLPVSPIGTVLGTQQEFLASALQVSYVAGGQPLWFWKDRIRLDPSVNSSWNLNLQNFTNNLFTFSLNLNLSIYKFLELSFSSVSNNTKTYRYIPGLPEQVGEPWVNPITDLLDSFDFFNVQTRTESAFKIQSLAFKIVHHLQDWDVTVQYQGTPTLSTVSGKYEWSPSFAINVAWVAVPQVNSNIKGDYTGVTLR